MVGAEVISAAHEHTYLNAPAVRAERKRTFLRERLTWLEPGQLAERIRYERWKRLSFLEDLELTESLQRGLACLRLEALAVEAGTVPDAVLREALQHEHSNVRRYALRRWNK